MSGLDPEGLTALRRALHRIPELGFEEEATSAHLRELVGTYARVRSIAGTGLVADLGPPDADRTLLLRADMDGLPIQEATGLAYASVHSGRMHACGHDAHMAALAAAGAVLASAPPSGVRVRLLFQPAEEGAGGATRCLEEGVLEGVDVAFGLHVWNELPVGTVAVTAGGIMAGVVEFAVEIIGRGGHGAIPHQSADPIVAGAQLVSALQTVASRRIAPVDPVVVTVGAFHAGDAFNVIPDSATLKGTVRAFSRGELDAVRRHMEEICAGVGAATGTSMRLTWRLDCVPTVNDAEVASVVRRAVDRVEGLNTLLTSYRTMAGEDFGDLLEGVAGCYVLVGSGNPGAGLSEPHHSPRFALDEAVLPLARDLHLAVAAEYAGG